MVAFTLGSLFLSLFYPLLWGKSAATFLGQEIDGQALLLLTLTTIQELMDWASLMTQW